MRAPFQRLGWKQWIRLILFAGLILFYVVYFSFEIFTRWNKVLGVSPDLMAFWSVGRITRQYGFSHIYDLEKLAQVQFAQYLTHFQFRTFPVPYFSFFTIPFYLMAFFNANTSFILWEGINLAALIAYLWFFIKKLVPKGRFPLELLIFMLLTVPVFQNFYWGQVGTIMVISVGEFIRHAIAKKPILSGIWLAGLMIKPQLLILILPVLLIQKEWKVILGFFSSATFILLISLLLSGIKGMMALFTLLLNYVPLTSNLAPDVMVNWRMIGLRINALTGSSYGWVVAFAGMVLSLILVLLLVTRKNGFGSKPWVTGMLGVFAATCVFTWHAYIHMFIILIPLLMAAVIYELIPKWSILTWMAAAPAIQLVFLFVGLAGKAGGKNLVPFIAKDGAFFILLVWLCSTMMLLLVAGRKEKIPAVDKKIAEISGLSD